MRRYLSGTRRIDTLHFHARQVLGTVAPCAEMNSRFTFFL
jgi:hypothetical protein